MKLTFKLAAVFLLLVFPVGCVSPKPVPVAKSPPPAAHVPIPFGPAAVDPKWRPYAVYLQSIYDRIQIEFDRLMDESRTYPPAGSHVFVKFFLTDEGKISRIASVENFSAGDAAQICVKAIMQPSPYEPWTDKMKAMLGKEQQLTVEFFYK